MGFVPAAWLESPGRFHPTLYAVHRHLASPPPQEIIDLDAGLFKCSSRALHPGGLRLQHRLEVGDWVFFRVTPPPPWEVWQNTTRVPGGARNFWRLCSSPPHHGFPFSQNVIFRSNVSWGAEATAQPDKTRSHSRRTTEDSQPQQTDPHWGKTKAKREENTLHLQLTALLLERLN